MLFLSLPKNEPIGTCRINGQKAEYRILEDHLEFRYEGQDAWDRRQILDASDDGELIQYFCDDGAESEEPYSIIQPVAVPQHDDHFYWLAINGASCAASAIPLPSTVCVRPTPEQLIGFRSREAQLAAQSFLLTAPINDVASFLKNEILEMIKAGEIVCINPENLEPPTKGQTIWETGRRHL